MKERYEETKRSIVGEIDSPEDFVVSSSASNSDDSIIGPPEIVLPRGEPTKCSVRKAGFVCAYAAHTNSGIFRSVFPLCYLR